MKKHLKIIAVAVVLIGCIPFIPPIYKKYTKPLIKKIINWQEWHGKNRQEWHDINPQEWYDEVVHKDLKQVRDYCRRSNFSTHYYIMVDFSRPSGKKRFFIYDLKKEKRVMSSYCMHGSGKGNTDAKPKFSNKIGSGCSSLGRYIMVGKGSARFKNCLRLRGLDKTNSMAKARGILIHSAGKVTRFNGETDYIPIGKESEGCFTVSRECVDRVMELYEQSSSKRPVLIWAKYK